MKFITIFALLSILLESTITTIPLVLIVLLFGAIITKSKDIFLLAFLSGLILDILTIRTIGMSSLFFVTFIFIVYLYDRKFEISTLYFIIVASFFGSFSYILMTHAGLVILQSFLASLIISFSYYIHSVTNKKELKYAKYG